MADATGGFKPLPTGSGGATPLTYATDSRPGSAASSNPGGLTQSQQSAFDYMSDLLAQYGLSSLAQTLRGLIMDGITDSASLSLALQNTNEWKVRFAGNEALRQKGLPVLSVAEYLANERSYSQALKQYGLPEGFYDDPSDFAKWIGSSVSPNEVMQRAQMYADVAKREDPAITQQLRSMGFNDGDLIAYMMDPARALPLVQQKYQTSLVGAAARRTGMVADNDYAQHLADLGITEQQAGQGYGLISEGLKTAERLGDIYGEEFGQRDFEQEVFENNGQASAKRKRLASQERAAFGGSSGIGRGSLGRNSGGSY